MNAGGGGFMQGTNFVVGMVKFEAISGGALSDVDNQTGQYTGIIQSLTAIISSTRRSTQGIVCSFASPIARYVRSQGPSRGS